MLKLKSFFLRLALMSIFAVPLWFVVAALGYKFGLWDLKMGLMKMVFAWGIYVLGAGFVIGLLALILSVAIKPRKGTSMILALIAMAIPVAGVMKAGSVRKTAAALPYIHDISTDTADAPLFSPAIMALRDATPGVNSAEWAGKKDPSGKALVADLQASGYPDIKPIKSPQAPALVFERSVDILKSQGWDIVTQDREAGVIEATDTTFWYGFKDDIIIRVRPAASETSLVDMRSLSRIGGSDLGKNAERIRTYRAALLK